MIYTIILLKNIYNVIEMNSLKNNMPTFPRPNLTLFMTD